MRSTVVVGQHLSADHPDVIDAMRDAFEVEEFDLLRLGDTIDALAGRNIACVISRIEYVEFFAAVTTMLAPTGTTVEHYVAWEESATSWTNTDLARLGLCGVLDVSLPTDSVTARVNSICSDCATCPSTLITELLDLPSDADDLPLSDLDHLIASLVARGLCDREISEVVHYSNQTIRNKMSRILRDNGLNNRTELATAQMRHAFRAYLAKASGAHRSEHPQDTMLLGAFLDTDS